MDIATQNPSAGGGFEPTGLAEWFRRRAARAPERPALTFAGDTWTYGAMQARVEAMAGVLSRGGVTPGARVAYLGLNHPMVFVALFAAARIGAILVPLNYRLAGAELAAIVADAGAQTLIVDARNRPLMDGVRASLDCRLFLCMGPASAGWQSIDALLQAGEAPPPARPCRADDVTLLLYTSGTTGRPKGVMLTHRNLWVNNINWILANDFVSGDVGLSCAPLFHAGGLTVVSLPILSVGGHLILHDGFDAGAFVDAIQRHRVTVSFGVPAMMLFASQHERFADTDLASLRLLIAGGAPVPEPLLRRYQERGVPVSQCYGMTEATSGVTFLETHRALDKLGSCGRAGLLSEVRLIDGAGQVIAEPQVRGEVCLRGGNVTPGYWQMPDATAQAFDADGWFRSGDVAYFDDEGFYYICDRLKDMVISGGENVYPAEVEAVLYDHPDIAEAAVIGAPDERWGERVVAVVALKPGRRLSLEQLQGHCNDRLARYKQPRELRVLPALPRNANGKVDKPALRIST